MNSYISSMGFCPEHQWLCKIHNQAQLKKESCKKCVNIQVMAEKRAKEAKEKAEKEEEKVKGKKDRGAIEGGWGV